MSRSSLKLVGLVGGQKNLVLRLRVSFLVVWCRESLTSSLTQCLI